MLVQRHIIKRISNKRNIIIIADIFQLSQNDNPIRMAFCLSNLVNIFLLFSQFALKEGTEICALNHATAMVTYHVTQ